MHFNVYYTLRVEALWSMSNGKWKKKGPDRGNLHVESCLI